MIRFSVPGTPKGKKRVDQDQFGRRFVDKETRALEREIGRLCRAAMASAKPLTGAVKLTISAVFAIPKGWKPKLREAALQGLVYHTQKPDADNVAKLGKDSLNGIAWHDDSQVAVELIRKRFGHPERTDITIEELAPPEGLEIPITPSEQRRVDRSHNERMGLLGTTKPKRPPRRKW